MSDDPLWLAIKRLNWAKAKCRKGVVSKSMIRRLEQRVKEEAAKVAEIFKRAWGDDWRKRIDDLAKEKPK